LSRFFETQLQETVRLQGICIKQLEKFRLSSWRAVQAEDQTQSEALVRHSAEPENTPTTKAFDELKRRARMMFEVIPSTSMRAPW